MDKFCDLSSDKINYRNHQDVSYLETILNLEKEKGKGRRRTEKTKAGNAHALPQRRPTAVGKNSSHKKSMKGS